MPELPEVETVKETLKKVLLKRQIKNIEVHYPNIIAYPTPKEFIENLKDQTITNIERRGKWLLFILNDYILLSHLRMEGRYYIKDKNEPITKHEHVSFTLDNDLELRYVDTRKFGRMYLYKKEDAKNQKPLNELGLEPFSEELTTAYLKNKFINKKLPIKTVLLDQSIITGIGNIYDDEILFMSKINPLKKASLLTNDELKAIITNTVIVLNKAIKLGGTTIRTYESSEGIHGLFQNELLVHTKDICPICQTKITKIKVNGRGTYYCPKCQDKE